MTLTYELVLDILKTYLHTESEASRSRLSKVRARTVQTHTDTQIDRRNHPLRSYSNNKNSTLQLVFVVPNINEK